MDIPRVRVSALPPSTRLLVPKISSPGEYPDSKTLREANRLKSDHKRAARRGEKKNQHGRPGMSHAGPQQSGDPRNAGFVGMVARHKCPTWAWVLPWGVQWGEGGAYAGR